MLSFLCKQRNELIIPGLLSQHNAVLTGDKTMIDLSTTENWPVKQKALQELQHAQDTLSEVDLAYAEGIGGCLKTRELLAELLKIHFRPASKVEPSHVVLAAGGSFALTALVEQICDQGDGVLIASPYWAGLDISISIHGHARIVPVDVPLSEFFGSKSYTYYESAIRDCPFPIKAVLMCNPHNPLGQCYPREAMMAMFDFCRRHNLHYISDEVYALSMHKPVPVDYTPFTSALELDAGQESYRIHVIYSLSKDFGCNGVRLGALISQSNEAVRLSAALSLHSQVSSFSTTLAASLISNHGTVLMITDYGGEKLKQAYFITSTFLEANRMKFFPVVYGMFVFARLVQIKTIDEEHQLVYHLKAAGVSVSPGTSYHFQTPGWFRICYGVPQDRLREGLRRVGVGIQNFLN